MPKASEIAAFLGAELQGDDCLVTGPATLDAPRAGALVFMNRVNPMAVKRLEATVDLLAIIPASCPGPLRFTHIRSDRPRRDFARAATRFFWEREAPGIAATARIHPTAILGSGITVGDYAVIGPGVAVGEGTVIRNGVVLGAACQIGRGCLIKSCAVLGEEGFGFDFLGDGTPIRLPHLGRVILGDDVEIGASTIVARGTMGETRIGDHVKIDDRVMVAHNVRIGANSIIASGAVICGSATLGDETWIAPNATIMNKVRVGAGSMVGLGAVVIHNVPPGVTVFGNPAAMLGPRPPWR